MATVRDLVMVLGKRLGRHPELRHALQSVRTSQQQRAEQSTTANLLDG